MAGPAPLGGNGWPFIFHKARNMLFRGIKRSQSVLYFQSNLNASIASISTRNTQSNTWCFFEMEGKNQSNNKRLRGRISGYLLDLLKGRLLVCFTKCNRIQHHATYNETIDLVHNLQSMAKTSTIYSLQQDPER